MNAHFAMNSSYLCKSAVRGFRRLGLLGALAIATYVAPSTVEGQTLSLPNYSFEKPSTIFVDTHVDSWQKVPKPDWYDESGGFLWDQLIGVFMNSAPDKPDHIHNVEGNQALYLFAVPQAGIFQDYASMDWSHQTPNHEFTSKFEAGKSYHLTVGVVGGGGGMVEGASLQLSFYYRETEGNLKPLVSLPVTYSKAKFPTTTHLVDFTVDLPAVKSTDDWAGKNIGVMMVSTVAGDKAGGYWDLDNVRVSATTEFVPIPNGSFELPITTFVDTRLDSWQKNPKPDWFDESGGFLWDQLLGAFKNPEPPTPNQKDNIDAGQALYLFAVPQVGLFQDYSSVDYAHATPTHEFNAVYESGNNYRLTVGVVGGGGGMKEGVTLLLNIYYRDGAGNMVTVGSTPITHTQATFPVTTHFVDFHVNVPVRSGDAWSGKNIGIMIVSAVDPMLAGGYWDLDNVRLTATPLLGLKLKIEKAGSNVQVSWISDANLNYQLRVSQDLKTWANYQTPVAGTGNEIVKTIPVSEMPHAFLTVTISSKP